MKTRKNKEELLKLDSIKPFLKTIEDYNNNPDDYVRFFTVQINGKKRNLVTYKADDKGIALRKYHRYFASVMKHCYKSCDDSFAYKEGIGVLQCLEQHMHSNTFLKSDIHEYFNSIDYEVLKKLVLEDNACRRRPKRISTLLKACFYEGHLPIGFITSPVLSDLYLHKIDKMFLEREGVIYTRYADDFIISGKDNIEELERVKMELANSLEEYGLELNRKKTYFRTLKRPGDAIHVLGVNLVNDETNQNRITISDKYIREVSKAVCSFINDYHELDKDELTKIKTNLKGRIEFIRHYSSSSYKKLERMIEVKSGNKLDRLTRV